MEQVRVRFAPSPTGHLHIGNARTAILNWIFARQAKGSFVLRIEDTDQARSTDESEGSILQDLRWLGLDWDEGPEAGGDFGPYRQSERLEIYQKYAQELLEKGHAYKCYCSQDELEEMRIRALKENRDPKYDGRHRNLSIDEQKAYEASGRIPAIRFLVPERDICFKDLVKEDVTFPAGDIGDFIILRADGMPTYNFAAVIDDALMKITHVIRGDDHLSNTPNQVALYEALKFPLPVFAHIPMILGEDRARLSKRHGAASVDIFAKTGFLADALFNFVSLLSWSSPSGDEILSKQRIIEEFDFSRMSKSAAIFDTTKLRWMNSSYIRDVPAERLTDLCLPYLSSAGYPLPADRQLLEKMVLSVKNSLDVLEDVIAKTEFYFAEEVRPSCSEGYGTLTKETTQKVFWSFIRQADQIGEINVKSFREIMKAVGRETGVLGKDLWMPVRVALAGDLHGPELPLIAEIYGKQKIVALLKKWLVE